MGGWDGGWDYWACLLGIIISIVPCVIRDVILILGGEPVGFWGSCCPSFMRAGGLRPKMRAQMWRLRSRASLRGELFELRTLLGLRPRLFLHVCIEYMKIAGQDTIHFSLAHKARRREAASIYRSRYLYEFGSLAAWSGPG